MTRARRASSRSATNTSAPSATRRAAAAVPTGPRPITRTGLPATPATSVPPPRRAGRAAQTVRAGPRPRPRPPARAPPRRPRPCRGRRRPPCGERSRRPGTCGRRRRRRDRRRTAERLGEAGDVGRRRDARATAELRADRRDALGKAGDEALAARDGHDGDGGVGEGVARGALAHAARPRAQRHEVAAGEPHERRLDLDQMRGQARTSLSISRVTPTASPTSAAGASSRRSLRPICAGPARARARARARRPAARRRRRPASGPPPPSRPASSERPPSAPACRRPARTSSEATPLRRARAHRPSVSTTSAP